MKPYFVEGAPPVSPSSIEALEREFGVTLPLDYVDFLLTYNGGLCRSEDERFDDSLFFGVIGEDEEAVVPSLWDEIYERTNRELIPIGWNLNEDKLYLRQSTGEVLLKKKTIARSFSHFVQEYLQPVEEDEED